MKKGVKISFFVLLLLLVLILTTFFYVKSLFMPVNKNAGEQNEIRLEIPYGTSVYSVSQLLYSEGLIKNQHVFYYAARYPQLVKLFFPVEAADLDFSLKSGIYHVNSSLSVIDLMKLLSSGQTEYVKVSVPEGLTISKIGAILEENRICEKDDFMSACRNSEIFIKYPLYKLFELGLIENCEGFLFPDTYFFNIGSYLTPYG